MAVYSEILELHEIIEKVKKFHPQNILIVACGGCSNESLAYKRGEPVFISADGEKLIDSLNKGTVIPYSSCLQAKEIKEVLIKYGYTSDIKIVSLGDNILCIQNELVNGVINASSGYDLILGICCPAGIIGIKKEFPNVPVIPLMKVKGQLFYIYKDLEKTREIIFEKSKIIIY